MRSTRLKLIISALTFVVFVACSKETEEFSSAPLSDYLPLKVGKYITYRLDSTLFTNFGTETEIHSYQEKHVVDSTITDASGRRGYRILRYIRNISGTGLWAPSGSYFIVANEKTVEVVENNLRFIKLALPLKTGFTWKGNQFLPNDPYSTYYSFSNDNIMHNWDYTIDSVNTNIVLNGNSLSNILKVVGIDEVDVIDTLEVTGTTIQIPNTSSGIYLRGNPTGQFIITAQQPKVPGKLSIYNRTSQTGKLETIAIPPNGGKSFEYLNNKWTFGFVDDRGIRRDTLYPDLPYGSKDVLIEKYAKDIGLVSQEFIMWEYQYRLSTNSGNKNGFEVRRTMIDHN